METFIYFVVVPVVIAVSVWLLFLIGVALELEWYVSAVAILLIGRYFIGLLSR